MAPFKHILFPVDFSKRCDAIRASVDSMVRHFSARLTLMHVVQIPVGWYGGIENAFPTMFDVPAMTAETLRALEAFFPASDFSPSEKFVEQGDPATLIPLYAERNAVDLIMMPTHGYGKFRALLLGSITAKALHDAKCPLWTSAHAEDSNPIHNAECRSVLCAVDTSSADVELIRHADAMARSYGARLRIVHALTPGEADPEHYLVTQFGQYVLEVARQKLTRMQNDAGTDVEICLEDGNVAAVVRKVALRHNADLVVIGRGKLHEVLGRLRTNAYAIIRDSPCPVISF